MGRRPCCVEEGLNRGSWSAIEDMILTSYINLHGEGKWRELPKRAGLKRCGKSCRLRWLNYLRPDIKRGNISKDEEDLIIKLHRLLGNRWSLIAGRLPGRTDNEIKNYWNTKLSKKIQGQTPKIRINGSVEKKGASESSISSETPPVIRTKASRCTRVFLPRKEGNEITKKNGESSRDCSRPSSSFQQVDDDSLDMLVGFDMNELLFMSDDLNSNCLQICSDGIRGSSNLVTGEDGWNISSWYLDDPFSTDTDVMLQGGSGNEAILENCSIDTLQPDEAFELKMLASFSELNWK